MIVLAAKCFLSWWYRNVFIVGLAVIGNIMNTTRVIESVDISQFQSLVSRHESSIRISPHALNHLSDSQRKVFKEEGLIDALVKEKPRGVGLQRNGRYSAFYRRKDSYLRIICELKRDRLEIITFITTESMPNMKRL